MQEKKARSVSLTRASEEYVKLLSYILDKPAGTLMTYRDAQIDTGIKMDYKGKQKLRRAILRSKREYEVFRDEGYKLADAGNIGEIVAGKLRSIDSRVQRAEVSIKIAQEQFIEELPPEGQKTILFFGSVFAAVRLSVEAAKKNYIHESKKPKTIESPKSVDIPNV